MPPPPHPDPTPNGARNLFLDADPIDDDALTEPGGRASKPTAPRRRGRGRIVAVDRPSPIAAATSSSSRAAGSRAWRWRHLGDNCANRDRNQSCDVGNRILGTTSRNLLTHGNSFGNRKRTRIK